MKELQSQVQRNYVENFALEKALIDPSPFLEKAAMLTRLRDLLEKSPEACLQERISIVASEILESLPFDIRHSVNRNAFLIQIGLKSEIYQFVETIQVYQEKMRKESGGFVELVRKQFGLFGDFLAEKFNGSNHKGCKYSKLEMKEKD